MAMMFVPSSVVQRERSGESPRPMVQCDGAGCGSALGAFHLRVSASTTVTFRWTYVTPHAVTVKLVKLAVAGKKEEAETRESSRVISSHWFGAESALGTILSRARCPSHSLRFHTPHSPHREHSNCPIRQRRMLGNVVSEGVLNRRRTH